MRLVLNLWVPGTPVAQGSKTMMPAGRYTRAPPKGPTWHCGDGLFRSVVMVESGKGKLEVWRRKVKNAAQTAWLEHGGPTTCHCGPLCGHWKPRDPLVCAVTVSMQFVFTRPKSHYTSTGALTKSAPREKTGKPDRGKLERAIEDSLTDAGVWLDDAQATASVRSEKRYGREAGAQIALYVADELF